MGGGKVRGTTEAWAASRKMGSSAVLRVNTGVNLFT